MTSPRLNRRRFLAGCTGAGIASAAETSGIQSKIASDRNRPQYHFLPPSNWMNDPNGPIFWRGKSHVFYQYNPNGAFSGSKHWGHAVTQDLVHWKNLPVALAPTPGGPDKDGVYTGCAVIDQGTPTMIFTGVRPEVQMIATSNDPEMAAWTKYSGNPVIPAPPSGLQVTGFRDPCVWKEDDGWYMAVGSGFKGVGGSALLYRSQDLRKWEYLHPLVTGKMDKNVTGRSVVGTGEMWECPDLFPLGSKHVLLVSTLGTVLYMVGVYKDHKFVPEVEARADFGCDYAPKTMLDGKGRRIWWGWIRERRSVDAQKAAGWSGVMSLPRILTIGTSGALRMEPAPELERLRGKRRRLRNLAIGSGEGRLIDGIAGDCLEIVMEIDPGDSEEIGLRVRCSPEGNEQTLIAYNRKDQSLFSDATRSSEDPAATRAIQKGRLALPPGEPLKLRIFLDGSVVEIFANGRACLTDRTYPVRPDSTGLRLHALGGPAKLRSMDVWEMQPISNNRMTSVLPAS